MDFLTIDKDQHLAKASFAPNDYYEDTESQSMAPKNSDQLGFQDHLYLFFTNYKHACMHVSSKKR